MEILSHSEDPFMSLVAFLAAQIFEGNDHQQAKGPHKMEGLVGLNE